jgi:hypothetical protein
MCAEDTISPVDKVGNFATFVAEMKQPQFLAPDVH